MSSRRAPPVEQLPAVAAGGGLAGASFALTLARSGRKVVVLERSRQAQHKVCGEFLSGEAAALLSALGIDIAGLGAQPICRFRLVRGERHATSRLPFAAAALSRYRLDEALLVAAARAGAEVRRGVAALAVESDPGRAGVRTEAGFIEASAVAVATGKHALRGVAKRQGPMVGFKLHLEPDAATRREFAGLVQLVFFRGGYAGACLIEDGILSVGWVLEESLLRTVGSAWEAQRRHLSHQSSLIGDHLARARPLFARPVAVAGIRYGTLRTDPLGEGLHPIGDQLAVVPSFTGDGMAIALYSGTAAARAVLEGRSAALCQRDLIDRLRPQFRFAAGVGRLLETPATCGIGVAAARLVPGLMTTVAAATRLRGFAPGEAMAAPPVDQRSATTK